MVEFKGIDVSEHQGDINWDKVKASGITFAMIRITYGRKAVDAKAIRNITECIRVGMPFGVYVYSYALDVGMAREEADLVIRTLAPYKHAIKYPVVIDMEDADGYKARNGNPGRDVLTNICIAECEAFENAGYYAMIYANLDWFNNRLDSSRLVAYDKWLAQWASRPTWNQPFGIWQYTSDGTVDGINGRVDMNISYKNYPAIIMDTKPAPTPVPRKSNEEIADEVIAGKWDNGETRVKLLTEAGYDYNVVQEIVNKKCKKKSNEEIANEIIREGKWGVGEERKRLLTEAGYDYNAIQAIVNEKMK